MIVNRLNDLDTLETVLAMVALPFGLVLFVIPLLVVIGIVVFGLGSVIRLKLRQWTSRPATEDEIREILRRRSERER